MMHILEILLVCVFPVAVRGGCYAPGPAFPTVDHVLNNTHFSHLALKLDAMIADVLKTPDGWTTNTTSFALQVTTREETVRDSFYTAPILGEYKDSGPVLVNGDTAFRIASISKSFTVYGILLENGISLDDPITKYIPELLEGNWPDGPKEAPKSALLPEWDQITIRSLASQLSGISREGGLSDLAVDTDLLPDPIVKGFPPVIESLLHPCMKNSSDRACTASEIIGTARKRPSVFAVNDRSTYSNVAFSLLGMVLEKATGKSYFEAISESILQPLGMNNTRATKPKDCKGIIPHGPNDWDQELGSDTPSGGLYCTANDLSKYLRSILSAKLLPQETVKEWMKPHSWGSGTHSAYGMPWEMLRTTKLTPDGRAIDIVTKGGRLTQYSTLIVMLPEYGLGVTLLVAGSYEALADLEEKLFATLVPEVEKLVRGEVRRIYAGTWASERLPGRSPNMNWSLKVEVDETGPGLRVVDWVSNGTVFLSVYGNLKGMPSDPSKWQARLIPSGIYLKPSKNERDQRFETGVWRLNAIPERTKENAKKIFDEYCLSDVDSVMYDGSSIEEFLIITEESEVDRLSHGMVMRIRGMRTVLWHLDEKEENSKSGSSEGFQVSPQVPWIFAQEEL